MKKPTNKEIRACDGSILNIEPMANSQKIAVAKKMVKAKPATIKLVLKSLKNTSLFCIKLTSQLTILKTRPIPTITVTNNIFSQKLVFLAFKTSCLSACSDFENLSISV